LIQGGINYTEGLMDFVFQKSALDNHKPIVELVRSPELRDAAEEIPDPPSDCDIRLLLKQSSPPQHLQALHDQFNDYRNGDEKKFSDPTQGMIFRNNGWLDVLRNELSHGNAFVGVGVSHLFGNEGVIKSLSDSGFIIQRTQ